MKVADLYNNEEYRDYTVYMEASGFACMGGAEICKHGAVSASISRLLLATCLLLFGPRIEKAPMT